MGRRQSRESAMQVLYEIQVGKTEMDNAFKHLRENFALSERDEAFARLLVNGVTTKITSLDEVIKTYSQDWQLDRIAVVDRNILRLALYEILFEKDIPYNVSINEAVELAKTYGGEKSSKFVNGILSAVIKKNSNDHSNSEQPG